MDSEGAAFKEKPKLHTLLGKLTQAMEVCARYAGSPLKDAKTLHLPAYHHDTEEERWDCHQLMADNGHYHPLMMGVSPYLPMASKEEINKVVQRARRDGTEKNFLIFYYFTTYGMIYLREEVALFNEMGDWYNDIKRSGQIKELDRTEGIIKLHVDTLYINRQPFIAGGEPSEADFHFFDNGASRNTKDLDSLAQWLTTFPEKVTMDLVIEEIPSLLWGFLNRPKERTSACLRVIKGYEATGLLKHVPSEIMKQIAEQEIAMMREGKLPLRMWPDRDKCGGLDIE